jgi:membrane-bound lytic murein transglycosylase D
VASADHLADSLSAPLDSSAVKPHEVTGEALKIFGDSIGVQAEEPVDAEPTWDIDVRSYETHERVAYFIDRYQHSARHSFAKWLARGGRYEPMIRSKLHDAGLPEDLTYLALIESGYDPNAYSRAAAVGMWQFMTSTAKSTGLRVDWWVDERRDPVRSTDGAIKFLKYLNEQFGSLYLAAAAYNGGPGRVSRGLTRYADELDGETGDDVFFALAETDYLRRETRDYVPRLIAAALIAKDPTRYGFDIEYDSALVYDTARVGPATPLAAVARATGTTVSTIIELNPEVLRGMTPPKDSFCVRIPPGTAASFDSSFAALPEAERSAWTRSTTKKGETLAKLARRAGVSSKELMWYNPSLHVSRSGHVSSGHTVMFPRKEVVAAALSVPDPSIERYGSSSRSTHVVRRGESLGLIAQRNHTSVKSIMRLNGLRKSIIYPGQVLVIRGSSRSTHARTTTASAGGVHVVRSGESLWSIARKYDTTVRELKRLNGLQSDRLRAGQKLVVRS